MEITLFNGTKIAFGNEMLLPNHTNRSLNTSYLNTFQFKNGKIKVHHDFLNRLCGLKNMQEYIKGTYEAVLDAMAGVGITAKIFSVDTNKTYVNDASGDCVKVLRKNFAPQNVYQLDVTANNIDVTCDLLIIDFNNFTWSKLLRGWPGKQFHHKKCLDKLLPCSTKYALITDSSAFGFKYGKGILGAHTKLFGQKINNLQEFYHAISAVLKDLTPGWGLKHIEYFNNASFVLLEKGFSGIHTLHEVVFDPSLVTINV